jgi:hypothetical protein
VTRRNDLGRALEGFDEAIDAAASTAAAAALAGEIAELHQRTGALAATLGQTLLAVIISLSGFVQTQDMRRAAAGAMRRAYSASGTRSV